MAKLTEADPAFADLQPGDVRVVPSRDRAGNITKTIVIERTARDYVFDVRDAYNAARSPAAIERGLEWIVTLGGELKISDDPNWARANRKRLESRNETERARHVRLQLEAARRGGGQ